MSAVSKARLERMRKANDLMHKIAGKGEIKPKEYRKLRELRSTIEPAVVDPEVGPLAVSYLATIDLLIKGINLLAEGKTAEAEAMGDEFAESCVNLSDQIRKFEGR
jgi:hypothetical protein